MLSFESLMDLIGHLDQILQLKCEFANYSCKIMDTMATGQTRGQYQI